MKRTRFVDWRRRAGSCALLTAALVLGLAAAEAGEFAAEGGGGALKPCHIRGRSQEALCGVYTVFENRAAAAGRQIEIHFAVIPAVDETSEPDPLVILAGGPGQAAMEMTALVTSVFSKVNESRDVVLIDQRGMGSSHPLKCEMADELLLASPEEAERQARKMLAECLAALDADVTLYTQDLANEDVHEILLTLGYERVNLYGGSWGTRSALLYAHQFPEHARTLILDGNLPLANRAPLHAAADAERAMIELFVSCQADMACAEAFPALRRDLETVMRRLGGEGRNLTFADPLTGDERETVLTEGVFGDALRSVLYSAELSRLAPLIIHQAAEGDYRAMLGVSSYLNGAMAESMSLGASLTIFCSEELARMQDPDFEEEMTARLLGHQMLESLKIGCSVWPKAPLPAVYSEDVRSPVPALILSGQADPITPPRWGDRMAEALPNSLHLVAPATGHNVGPQGCASELIELMINQGNVEGLDGSCLEELTRPSFFINSSGPSTAGPANPDGSETGRQDD